MRHPREYEGTWVVPVVGVGMLSCIVVIQAAAWPLPMWRSGIVSACIYLLIRGLNWMWRGSERSSSDTGRSSDVLNRENAETSCYRTSASSALRPSSAIAPFSGAETRCLKCKSRIKPTTRWRSRDEALTRECPVCCYAWPELGADALRY